MKVGSGLGYDERRTQPAEVLVPNWNLGKPAAFDLTCLIKASSLKHVCLRDNLLRFQNNGNMPMMLVLRARLVLHTIGC